MSIESKRNWNVRLLSYGFALYAILAFGWWAVLLNKKNEELFKARETAFIVQHPTLSKTELSIHPDYINIASDYRRQRYMIVWEAATLMLILLAFLWVIRRAFNRSMQYARREKNFLLAITHELKTPLASIKLGLETLQQRKLSPDQQAKVVQGGLKETDRLNELLNNVLLASRLGGGDFRVTKEKLDLKTLAENNVQFFKRRFPEMDVRIIAPEDAYWLQADDMALDSILQNLMENAWKYSPDQKLIEIELSQMKNRVQMEVSDSGIGIPEADREKVFQSFFRLGDEHTRKTKGTGLGLYIVRKLVEAHQGTIQILSNEPQGTTFSIQLPTL